MPHIEDNTVSLGYRPFVNGLVANHAEYLVGSPAGVKQSGVKVVTDADSGSRRPHGVLPLLLDAASTRRMRQNSAVRISREARCIKMFAP